jgi:hypothetical protein
MRSTNCDTGTCVEVGFQRSSKCEAGGCVEVGFQRSTKCESGQCVEVDRLDIQDIRVRDGKDPDSPILSFTKEEWEAFIQGVKAGEFDLE